MSAEEIDGLLSRLKAADLAFVSSDVHGTRPVSALAGRSLSPHESVPSSLLYTALRRGESIKLNFVERRLPGVAAAVRALQDFVQLPLNDATIFVTPPGASALPPHYDDEHTFTLQLAGEKTWGFHRVAEPGEPTPMSAAKAGRARSSATLRAGDLLYVPRRVVHSVRSSRALALSVGVGFRGLAYRDLLHGWLKRAIETLPEEPLPCRWFDDPRVPLRMDDALTRLVPAARRSLRWAFDDIRGRQLRERLPIREGALERSFSTGARWSRPEEVECLVHREKAQAVLSFPGAEPFRVPRLYEAALRFVARRTSPFRAADLPLPAAKRAELLDALHALGVIHPVP